MYFKKPQLHVQSLLLSHWDFFFSGWNPICMRIGQRSHGSLGWVLLLCCVTLTTHCEEGAQPACWLLSPLVGWMAVPPRHAATKRIARALRHASLCILVGCKCFCKHFPKPETQLATCCKKREVCFWLSWGVGKSNCVWMGWSRKQLCPALPPCFDSIQKRSHRELQALAGVLRHCSVLSPPWITSKMNECAAY